MNKVMSQGRTLKEIDIRFHAYLSFNYLSLGDNSYESTWHFRMGDIGKLDVQ